MRWDHLAENTYVHDLAPKKIPAFKKAGMEFDRIF